MVQLEFPWIDQEAHVRDDVDQKIADLAESLDKLRKATFARFSAAEKDYNFLFANLEILVKIINEFQWSKNANV